jgi:uncharacterized protein
MKSINHNKPAIAHGWLRALLFLILYFLISLTAGFLLALIKLGSGKAPQFNLQRLGDQRLVYAGFLLIALISFGLVAFFRKWIDRRSFSSLGFGWKGHEKDAAAGFLLGSALLCTGTLILVWHHNLEWTDIRFNSLDLFSGIMVMALIAAYEELVFRGYVLHNLMQSLPSWPALLVSAGLFALAHAGNPYINWVGWINIFLAGCLLGVNYIHTRNLWFGIFLHFSWNFFQGPLLGFDVSGLNLQSLLQQELKGSPLLTGGGFGFEGSLTATLLCLPALAALGWVYRRKQFRSTPA